MSTPTPPTVAAYRWHEGTLHLLEYFDPANRRVEAADSWLVSDGRTLALDLHRRRFFESLPPGRVAGADLLGFWDAAIGLIPRDGDWFPRVELQSLDGTPLLVFRLRTAPERTQSVRLATHHGPDPRTAPTVKGPDFAAMLAIRTQAQQDGADEAVILSPDGYVIEGAYSSLLWWRGSILCAPAEDLPRVDSVTARSLLGLAAALGVEVFHEAVTPAELDGTEVWALSALHGPRIVTSWVDGPSMAELPGRLGLWRSRLSALAHPLP